VVRRNKRACCFAHRVCLARAKPTPEIQNKVMLNLQSVDHEEEASDLEALMEHWSCCEAACFSCPQSYCQCDEVPTKECKFSNEQAIGDSTGLVATNHNEIVSSNDHSIKDAVASVEEVTSEMRLQAVHLLRCLVTHHAAAEELPAAITLFDAFCAKRASGKLGKTQVGSLSNPTSFAAIVAAIARVTLKCGAVAHSQEQFSPCIDTMTEVHIIEMLDGRLRLPSIFEWSNCMVSRLYLLSAPDLELQQTIQQATPAIYCWVRVFLERLPANSSTPPKVLAIVACSLGLISVGAMAVEEESLLMKLAPAAVAAAPEQVLVSVDALAKAACCDAQEVRQHVIKVAGTAQEVV